MPVFNGARFVRRSYESVRKQTLAEWELLAVDDGSTDNSSELLDALALSDPRVRVFKHRANRGLSAARNTALAGARGYLIAYLDCDDEFYPEHLAKAWEWRNRAEVLLFQYDLIEERADSPSFGSTTRFDPATRRDFISTETIAVPLGVVHRRSLLARSGYFDETLGKYRGQDEDGDLWRRFARVGATFTGVPTASGLYHIRSDSLARTRPIVQKRKVLLPPGIMTVEIARGGFRRRLFIPAGQESAVRKVFEETVYSVPRKDVVRSSPVIFDIGAGVGLFALYCRLSYGRHSTVHCFEPTPANIELLRRNVMPFQGIKVHPIESLHSHSPSMGGDGHIESLTDDQMQMIGRSVRERWDELGVEQADLLKVDTGGCELQVLDSLGAQLNRVRTVLVGFRSNEDLDRVNAILGRFVPCGLSWFDVAHGVAKYVRSDLAD